MHAISALMIIAVTLAQVPATDSSTTTGSIDRESLRIGASVFVQGRPYAPPSAVQVLLQRDPDGNGDLLHDRELAPFIAYDILAALVEKDADVSRERRLIAGRFSRAAEEFIRRSPFSPSDRETSAKELAAILSNTEIPTPDFRASEELRVARSDTIMLMLYLRETERALARAERDSTEEQEISLLVTARASNLLLPLHTAGYFAPDVKALVHVSDLEALRRLVADFAQDPQASEGISEEAATAIANAYEANAPEVLDRIRLGIVLQRARRVCQERMQQALQESDDPFGAPEVLISDPALRARIVASLDQ